MLARIISYFCLVVRTALRPSISWAELVIDIIIIIAEVAAWLAPYFGMSVEAGNLITMLRSPECLAALAVFIIAFRLVCSQYWVWESEHAARIKAEEAVNDRESRKNTIVTLSKFLTDGNSLIEKCNDETIQPPTHEIESWMQNIKTVLMRDLDESYVRRFCDGSGVINYVTPGQRSPEHIKCRGHVRVGLARLNQFIEELI